MDTIERLYAPVSERASRDTAIAASLYEDSAIALRPTAAGGSFSWAMHFLPVQRRQALCALYALCREVDGITDGEASRTLKETLLSNWRAEIAHLYVGTPRNAVALGLSKATHLYGLWCRDFLAIIDGAEIHPGAQLRPAGSLL